MDWKKLITATAICLALTTNKAEARSDKMVIQDHLEQLPDDRKKYARYFTTDHLVDTGYSQELLDVYVHLLRFLVNSFSWVPWMLEVTQISDSVYYFNMGIRTPVERDGKFIGFTTVDRWKHNWDKLIEVYPHKEELEQIQAIRADWFLATASTGDLYYDLLFDDDADTLDDLEHLLDIRFGVKVAAVKQSNVSFESRAIEMYNLDHHKGRYWKSYDYRIDTDHDAVNDLIGEYGLSYGDYDGGEMIFNLPNGLQGYYVADRFGKRITEAPTDIVQARNNDLKLNTELKGKEEGQVLIGVSCMTCHTDGINYFLDQAWDLGKHTDKYRFFLKYWDDEREDANDQYKNAILRLGGQVGTTVAPYRIKDVYNNYDQYGSYMAPRKPQRSKQPLQWANLKRK